MELSHLIIDAVWRPSFVLKYHELQNHFHPSFGRIGTPSWDRSFLNPRNRVDTLDTTSSRWRIDGATICGNCIYAIPLDLLPNLPPLRILLYVTDQTEYPAALREGLDACTGVPLRDGKAIADLGLAKHLCRALDNHCARQPSFLQQYLKLPFGSRLVFEDIAADVGNMRLDIERDYDIESNMETFQSLQQSWSDVSSDAWPPTVDIYDLHLIKQLNEAISVVEAPGHQSVIFKAATKSLHHTYHELHLLLTCPPHPHVMPHPLAVVTKKSAFGGKHGVVGFLLQYFEAGSLRDVLPARQRAGTLPNSLKLKWGRQVASALVHLNRAGTFYSDLRPDNVLLDSEENVILCDFEQRGNWYEWCAPEVLYRQYAENIRSRLPERIINSPFDRMLAKYTHAHTLATCTCYTPAETPMEARNRAWFALPPVAQEKASVYSLGLLLYTIFEGLSNVQRNVANQFPIEPDLEFPTIFRTPESIHKIIKRCTTDAPDWEAAGLQSEPSRVVRMGGLLYPEARPNLPRDTRETFDATMASFLDFWSIELGRAEKFLESPEWETGNFGRNRPRLREVLEALEALENLSSLD
ncbi:kinase-like domain-containing protein [Aspergillus pseudoustus]|uniref:Kinase-like domain-containing protein n=1 Tax=Aspergillus pseudoustus TaxID=1810923 RepID=A0ABR4JBI8_9EURO